MVIVGDVIVVVVVLIRYKYLSGGNEKSKMPVDQEIFRVVERKLDSRI